MHRSTFAAGLEYRPTPSDRETRRPVVRRNAGEGELCLKTREG